MPDVNENLVRPASKSSRLTEMDGGSDPAYRSVNQPEGAFPNMFWRRILPALIGLVLTPATAIVAQETATSPAAQANQNQVRRQGFERRDLRARKRVAKQSMRDGLRQLNLTDQQKQQRRDIIQRHLSALKTQREQLFQLRTRKMEGSFSDEDRARARNLRQELRTSMQGVRTELRNALTADQRAQLESFREQRKQRREEFMKQRQEFRRARPQE